MLAQLMTLLRRLARWLTAGWRPPSLRRLLWAIMSAIKQFRQRLSSRDHDASKDRDSAQGARIPQPSFSDANLKPLETFYRPACASLEPENPWQGSRTSQEADIIGTGRKSQPDMHGTDGLVEETEEAEEGTQE
jgi:hypothetical protein